MVAATYIQHATPAPDTTATAVTMVCGLQLLDTGAVGVRREKMYRLDNHIACAVAGITGMSSFCMSSSYKCLLTIQPFPLALTGNSQPADPFTLIQQLYPAADANILINTCRLAAQRYLFAYQEPIPVEQLVKTLCDNKQVSLAVFVLLHRLSSPDLSSCSTCVQGYTQYGGLRPFGVSLLYAGW